MSVIKEFVNKAIAIDWRNEQPEDDCDVMNEYMDTHDCFEFTIDDLRDEGINDSNICEVMQCFNIYTIMSMI
jgi:hypothetical protein